jgi:hypothetical protein
MVSAIRKAKTTQIKSGRDVITVMPVVNQLAKLITSAGVIAM